MRGTRMCPSLRTGTNKYHVASHATAYKRPTMNTHPCTFACECCYCSAKGYSMCWQLNGREYRAEFPKNKGKTFQISCKVLNLLNLLDALYVFLSTQQDCWNFIIVKKYFLCVNPLLIHNFSLRELFYINIKIVKILSKKLNVINIYFILLSVKKFKKTHRKKILEFIVVNIITIYCTLKRAYSLIHL